MKNIRIALAAAAALMAAALALPASAAEQAASGPKLPEWVQTPAKNVGLLKYIEVAARMNMDAYQSRSFDDFWTQYTHTIYELNDRQLGNLSAHAQTLAEANISVIVDDETTAPVAVPRYKALAILPKCTPAWHDYLLFLDNYGQYIDRDYLNIEPEAARKGMVEADRILRKYPEFSHRPNLAWLYTLLTTYYLLDNPTSQYTYVKDATGGGQERLKSAYRKSFDKFLAENKDLIVYPAAKKFLELVAQEKDVRTPKIRTPGPEIEAAIKPYWKPVKPAAAAAAAPAKAK